MKATTDYERSHITDGVPLAIPAIRSLLKDMNKYLPGPVLKLWMEQTAPYLRFKDFITSSEFLFLVANCKSRTEAVAALPYGKVSVTPEPTGTYEIDEIVKYPGHPDQLLESMAEKYIVLDRTVFTGNTEKRLEKRSVSSHSKVRHAGDVPSLESFRKAISNTEQMAKIHRVIEDCQQKLNAAKLGGRLTFEEKHSDARTHEKPQRVKSAGMRKQNLSFLDTSSVMDTRKSVLDSSKCTGYIPPHVLFPKRPKFHKVIRRRKTSSPTASLKSPTRTWSLSRASGKWLCTSTGSFELKRTDTLDTSATTTNLSGRKKPSRRFSNTKSSTRLRDLLL